MPVPVETQSDIGAGVQTDLMDLREPPRKFRKLRHGILASLLTKVGTRSKIRECPESRESAFLLQREKATGLVGKTLLLEKRAGVLQIRNVQAKRFSLRSRCQGHC